MSIEERKLLKQTVGQLLWVANQTRPDISFDTCYLSNSISKATVSDVLRANKVIRKLKMTSVSLIFKPIQRINTATVYVFADASFKSLPCGASQGGFIIFLGDSNGNVCPIHWQSKKVKRIVKSTLAAECLSLQEACDVAFYIKTVLTSILSTKSTAAEIDILCFTDNKSLLDSLYSTNTLVEKRLILDEAILKEMISKKEIKEVSWIESGNQIADPLTKSTASTEKLCNVLAQGSIAQLF